MVTHPPCVAVVAPFGLLLPEGSTAQRLASRTIILLMFCIGLVGRYAWFNLVTAACVWPLAVPAHKAVPSPDQAIPSHMLTTLQNLLLALWTTVSIPFIFLFVI